MISPLLSPFLQTFGRGTITHFESLLDSSLSIFKENIRATKPETMDLGFNIKLKNHSFLDSTLAEYIRS